QHGGRMVEHELNPPRDEVGQGHASFFVRNVGQIRSRPGLEQLAGEVTRCAIAGSGKIESVRTRPGQCDEVRHVLSMHCFGAAEGGVWGARGMGRKSLKGW